MTNVSWPIRGIETVVAVNPKFSAIYQTWREAGDVGTWVRKSSLFSWKNRGSSSWSLLDLSARWLYNLPRTLHVIHNHYLTPITEAVYYYPHFPLCNVYQPSIIYNRSCKREIFLVLLSRSSFRLIKFALLKFEVNNKTRRGVDMISCFESYVHPVYYDPWSAWFGVWPGITDDTRLLVVCSLLT